jgi:DNA-binding response OmpR family regulator
MNQTILILDDDATFRRDVLRPQLEHRGYEVHEAARIREAEALLAQRSFDLLIVDGLLPDGNGLDFISALRQRGVATPIVFLSAFWKDGASLRALAEAGATDTLHKPVDFAVLARRIECLLATGSARC